MKFTYMQWTIFKVHNKVNNSKRGAITRTAKRIQDSLFVHGKRFKNAIRNLHVNLKRFIKWLKKNIRNGVQCFLSEANKIKCQTKGKLYFKMQLPTWEKLPTFLKKKLFTTNPSTNSV